MRSLPQHDPRASIWSAEKDLADALAGAEVVVDTSNPGYADAAAMERFFAASGANLGTAAREAGVRHLVALSAVGADRDRRRLFSRQTVAGRSCVMPGCPYDRSFDALYEFIYKIVDAGGEGDRLRLAPVHDAASVARRRPRDGAGADHDSATRRTALSEIAGPDRHRPRRTWHSTILTAERGSALDRGRSRRALFRGALRWRAADRRSPTLCARRSFEDWLRAWFAAV